MFQMGEEENRSSYAKLLVSAYNWSSNGAEAPRSTSVAGLG